MHFLPSRILHQSWSILVHLAWLCSVLEVHVHCLLAQIFWSLILLYSSQYNSLHINGAHYNRKKLPGMLFKQMWLNNHLGTKWTNFWVLLKDTKMDERDLYNKNRPNERLNLCWSRRVSYRKVVDCRTGSYRASSNTKCPYLLPFYWLRWQYSILLLSLPLMTLCITLTRDTNCL